MESIQEQACCSMDQIKQTNDYKISGIHSYCETASELVCSASSFYIKKLISFAQNIQLKPEDILNNVKKAFIVMLQWNASILEVHHQTDAPLVNERIDHNPSITRFIDIKKEDYI
eukprot:450798_1